MVAAERGSRSLLEAAQRALELATITPEEADSTGRLVERDAEAARDLTALSVARRARGVAAMQQRKHERAIRKLDGAVEAALSAGQGVLAGEARMSLASALVLRGAPDQAFATIELALGDLSGLAAARARTQRSAILQELGRVGEALEDLRMALPVLRRAGDVQWETRALSNRSLLFSSRRQFAAAEADLLRARALCIRHGLTLPGAYVEQNLGCLHAARGDVPAALAHFDRAESAYGSLGLEVGSLWIDRAKVLLTVRLMSEARNAAERAADIFAAQGRWVHLPEAQLMISTVALLDGDALRAQAAAEAAEAAFDRLGRSEWRTLARFSGLQAEVLRLTTVDRAHASATPVDNGRLVEMAGRLRTSATELERSGWTIPALEARVIAGRAELSAGRAAAARRDFAEAARARRTGPADARARAWLGEALLRESEGNRRGSLAALKAGVRVVADYRQTLGATELRAHISAHRGALAQAGLRMALSEGRPAAVHWWAEAGRASAEGPRAVLPPQDPTLAGLLEDLRSLMAVIEETRSAGAAVSDLTLRQTRLEQTIRDHCRALDSDGRRGREPPKVPTLAAELGDSALIEFVDLDDDLAAVTIVDGRARLHRLGDKAEVCRQLVHLPFALQRMAAPATRSTQLNGAQLVVERAARELQARLVAPLAAAIGDRPLVIVPAGWLQSVPWSILPACTGRPVTVVPSAALWLSSSGKHPASDRVVVVAGPGLPGAASEAARVATLYPGAAALGPEEARVERVAAAIDGAALVHFAAHGVARRDNALFSSLTLTDGPFTAYDFERVGVTPHHVVMAACDTAVSQVTAGEEILGLAAALLNQQTATLLAPIVAIPDVETEDLMVAYHRRLASGMSPARALAGVQQASRDAPAAVRAAAASFVCLGAAERSLVSPTATEGASTP